MGDADSEISEGQLSDHISEAATSESGRSDDEHEEKLEKTARREAAKRRAKQAQKEFKAPTGANCCMCETQRSEFQCIQCGRLTFCLKCCVSLHDNKFLGCHKLEDVDAGEVVDIAALKHRIAKPPIVESHGPTVPPQLASPTSPASSHPTLTSPRLKKKKEEPEEVEVLDREALATDRRVILSRVKELKSTVDFLRRLEVDFAQEKDANRDSAAAACEAIKKKFDILRGLISAKESEFLTVVKSASKERSEKLNKGSLELMSATSELDGYVTHTEAMVDRLQLNPRMFNTTRVSMLEESEERLQGVEETIHKFQDVIDTVHGIPLGMHLSLETAVEGIQKLDVPQQLTHRNIDPPHFTAIPADKFLATPGVRVVSQHEAKKDLPQVAPFGEMLGASPRRGLAAEVRELQKLSMASVTRAQSPAKQPGAFAPSPMRPTLQPATEPLALETRAKVTMIKVGPPEPATNNLLSRTAARRASSPKRIRSLFPPELEALKKQVAAQRAAAGGAADKGVIPRAASPAKRTGTPTRISLAPPRFASPKKTENVPGPGSYFRQQPFGLRSVVSTPPRRR